MGIKYKIAVALSCLGCGITSAMVVPSVTSFSVKPSSLTLQPQKLVCQLLIQYHLIDDPELKQHKLKKKKKKFL